MSASTSDTQFDEAGQLRSLQRDAAALAKHLEAIAKLRPSDPKALDVLEKAITSLPPSATLAGALEELRDRASRVLSAARAARGDGIRRIEADYVRSRKAAGDPVREAGSSSWRLGKIELEVDRGRARARALYNHEVVVPWCPIARPEDLQKLVTDADKRITDAAIPEETLARAFSEAYDHLRRTTPSKASQATRVALKDFYREVRVVLARHELLEGKPDKKLARPELPLWAFLFNLDRYLKRAPALPAHQRLTFETGSQTDHGRGLAMVVNGLDANGDYKTYCYVYAEQPAQ